ncbi:DUF1444 family protein [Kallotenue papyrolyticum]|uniref:DUF1444 family protein n=1 Tax=Kallotenue papyrolyticum TaxID=1325125 RepID=UPI00049250B0|nr:DUF1444 family protein [Kallotenue papyrolyticum]
MSQDAIILSPYEFTQAAAHLLATQGEVEIVDLGELTLELRVSGRDVAAELHNFYALYRHAPEQLPAIWDALRAAVLELPPDRSEDDPETLLERVMPMLKPLALLQAVRERRLPLLAYRPLVGQLMLAYVIDEGRSVAYINEDHLRTWRVDEALLHRRALANLRRRPWRPQPGRLGSGAQSLLIFNSGDGYDATRVILPELFSEFAASIPGRLVLGVPNRDFLIAFSDADPEIVERIRAQIARDQRAQQYPLSDELLTYRAGRLELYDPPAAE